MRFPQRSVHKRLAVIILLSLFLTTSCATLVPHSETVIRLPQEHQYVHHVGRIPMVYVRTFPREYWNFSLAFKTPKINGILMTGDALMATLREALGTVFRNTERAASGDFIAMVNLDRFSFTYTPRDNGSMEFKASLSFVIVDKADRKIDTVNLHASTIALMPDEKPEQLRTAANAFAVLLSMMEKDLASHVRNAWDEGRYAAF